MQFWIGIWGFGCLEAKKKLEHCTTDAFSQVNIDPKLVFLTFVYPRVQNNFETIKVDN